LRRSPRDTAAAAVAGQYVAIRKWRRALQLIDANNEEILDFSYDNSWYPVTMDSVSRW
jgi:hypothetical protein